MAEIINADIKNFSYGIFSNLKNINLNISKGEIILLTGNSGCGKTTLLRLLTGLVPSFYEGKLEGWVKLFGKNLSDYKKGELAKHIGLVFQNPKDQFFCTIVEDEIALVGENLGMPHDELIKKVDEVIKIMDIEKLRRNSIFSLSGGERQRVAIASVLIYDTEVLFFDEPSASLDYESIENFKKVIQKLKAMGKTIVIAEHRLYYLKDLFDRLIYMRDGTIESVYKREEFSEEHCQELGLRTLNEEKLKAEKLALNTEVLESFKDISVFQNKRQLIKPLSFSLRKGEVMGIIGKNGSGKTTLARTLTGLMGKNQETSLGLKERERLRNSYYVQQDVDSQIFLDTVENELLTTTEYQEQDRIKQLLKEIDLWEERTSHPQKLSGGQKQRLAVITAFLSGRRVMIFDEPTSGLDYKNMEIMAKLMGEFSKISPIVVITHDMELLFKCCHSALFIGENEQKKIDVKGNEREIFEFIRKLGIVS
ncbi:MAG: ABC transporter ATP-binding protein [Peptococcales bacterium]|jgi:energy-coupling factor transporter ATP-binding protein EcfA2